MSLYFCSAHVDSVNDPIQVPPSSQDSGERLSDVVDEHEAAVQSSVRNHGLGTSTAPSPATPSGLSSPKVGPEWTDASGIKHKAVTEQKPGESEVAWQARHDAAQAALQAKFPPVP